MNVSVIRAIFKRNFVSYFSNPTGYVFICVFVLLTSFAAFWPNEFFNANLANLDQLNKYLPFIMLVFIPAITMSIWADERRQGTDELLLTIPAGDFDVVLGKYLAAVAIFGVSLLFSFICNLAVLKTLGDPDAGLILGTYFGYFVVGLAMLGVGMVASFLTGNLTVGFILGVVFNAPLAFAGLAPEWLQALRQWSIKEQFHDFARGVVSISSVLFFLSVVALMLYVSMVLIGRRHWRGGTEGRSVAMHYFVRVLALMVVVTGLNLFLSRHNSLRMDVTSQHLSSLSPQTRLLIKDLKPKYPVTIDAYYSKEVPETYVQTKMNLVSALQELDAIGGDKVVVHAHEVEPFSKEASQAEQQFGIRPQQVESRSRGARTREDLFMGVAFTSGLDKVVVPFLDKGIPVEYELVRSIATVCQEKRKKIGVLTTDAKLYGGFDMQNMSSTRNELIIDELQKQYEVVQVDPSNPITETYDVLLAVQPSSLTPPQMDNFVAAVKGGQPTAIFEDPFPYFSSNVPGTQAPKQPPGGQMAMMMGGRQPPQPKGDINQLWQVLGIEFSDNGGNVVWQDYNPYPKAGAFISREWVFVDQGSGAKRPFNEKSAISSKLQQLLFLFPGYVRGKNASNLKFTELVSTSENCGTVGYEKIVEPSFMGAPRINPELANEERPTPGEKYTLAAYINGTAKPSAMPMSDKEAESSDAKDEPKSEKKEEPKSDDKTAAEKPKEPEIKAVVVADIDCLYSAFFALRARGDEPEDEIDWDFDNVTFILNVLDSLSGDERFIEIRKRRPEHPTLTRLNRATERAKDRNNEAREKFVKEFKTAKDEEQKKFDDEIAALRKRTGINQQQALTEVMMAQQVGQRRLETKTEQLKQKRDREVKQSERELAMEVRRVQDSYKMWAVLLPPIPPLLVAFFVFFNRRAREREGVAKSRLR